MFQTAVGRRLDERFSFVSVAALFNPFERLDGERSCRMDLTTSNYRDVQRGVRTTITSLRGGRAEGTSIISCSSYVARAIKLVRIARNYKRALLLSPRAAEKFAACVCTVARIYSGLFLFFLYFSFLFCFRFFFYRSC